MSNRFTTLPCGLRIRLDIHDGDFDLVGDFGSTEDDALRKMSLSIVTSTDNLLALSEFFLKKAREAHLEDSTE